jgi:hypothetical protein
MKQTTPDISPKKTPVILYLLMFLIGITGVIGLRYLQVRRQNEITQTPATTNPLVSPTPLPSPYVYHPPSTAISGIITAVSGKVQKSSWNSDDMSDATATAQIFQSEKVVTPIEATASVSFSGLANIDLGPESIVNFTSLIPDRILFTQPAGLVTYKIAEDKTISVRTLSVLVTAKTGTLKIEPDEGYIYLNQVLGESTYAIVDENNDTQIYTLKEKHRATINDTSGSVWIR